MLHENPSILNYLNYMFNYFNSLNYFKSLYSLWWLPLNYFVYLGCLPKTELKINPNMAGLFEGSFFWGGVNFTPFIFQEELIQYQYNFMQL